MSFDQQRSARRMNDEVTKLRMQLLEHKMKLNRERAFRSHRDWESPRYTDRRETPADDHVSKQLKVAQERQKELRDLVEELADSLYRQRQKELMLLQLERPPPPPAWPQPTRPSTPPKSARKSKDRFDQMMEMMMLQHTQTQNMVMNRFLMEPKSRNSPTNPPLPPLYPPQPLIYHPYGLPPPDAFHYPPPAWPGHRKPSTPTATPQPAPAPKTNRRMAKPLRPESVQYPFPGNESQRKIRQLGYAALFCSHLHKQSQRNNFRPEVGFLFDLKLKEIIAALHRIYLAADRKIFPIMRSAIFTENAYDYGALIRKNTTIILDEQKRAIQEIAYVLENLVYNITEIMPNKGVLGTHRKSLVFELIRSDQKFPADFFYNFEKEMIAVSGDNRTINVTNEDASALLIAVYLDRAMSQSLLQKPVHYRIVNQLDAKMEGNGLVIRSLLFYVYRVTIAQLNANKKGLRKGAKLVLAEIPQELSNTIYADEVMQPLIKKLKKSIDYVETLILNWSDDYVRRLRSAAF